MRKGPPWYRIMSWAKLGNWERDCNTQMHMSFSRNTDCIEVNLQGGRAFTAHWHRHDEDGTAVLMGEGRGDELTKLEDWFLKEGV